MSHGKSLKNESGEKRRVFKNSSTVDVIPDLQENMTTTQENVSKKMFPQKQEKHENILK